jgi:hypothetical protein
LKSLNATKHNLFLQNNSHKIKYCVKIHYEAPLDAAGKFLPVYTVFTRGSILRDAGKNVDKKNRDATIFDKTHYIRDG